jgi:diguanylate cyclase (GGDEF)-like protein
VRWRLQSLAVGRLLGASRVAGSGNDRGHEAAKRGAATVSAQEAGASATRASRIAGGVRVLCWLYLSALVWLACWVTGVMLVIGWHPQVVTGASLEPSLVPGDVIMVQPTKPFTPERGEVLTYSLHKGTVVVGRVLNVGPEQRFTVIGGTNGTSKPITVSISNIVGVGRLVVPMLGLPVVWAAKRSWLVIAVWSTLTLAAVVISALSLLRSRQSYPRRRDATSSSSLAKLWQQGEASFAPVSSALRKLRPLAAGLIVTELYGHRSALSSGPWHVSFTVAAGSTVEWALLATAVSLAQARVSSNRAKLALAASEIALDTLAVLALTTVSNVFGPDVTWALLVVPVLESSLRFRMRGAVVTWMFLALTYPLIFLWQQAYSVASLLTSLQTVSSRLGVVLIIAVPSGFLSEHLLAEMMAQSHARALSTARARVLGVVAESASEAASLGGDVLAVALRGLLEMGFVAGQVSDENGTVLASAGERLFSLANDGQGSTRGTEGANALNWHLGPGGRVEVYQGPGALDRSQDHKSSWSPGEGGTGNNVVVIDCSSGTGQAAVLASWGVGAVAYTPLGQDGLVLMGATAPGGPTSAQVEGLALLARLAGVAVRSGQLHDDLRRLLAKVEHDASHDALTGLPNRASFHLELEKAVSAQSGSNALLYCDLDGFKPVNDTYGHEVGDRLLVAVAQRLRSCVSAEDGVFRLGGDEFVVLVSSPAAKDVAPLMAERICKMLAAPFDIGGIVVNISVTIGVAVRAQDDEPDDWVRRADEAMYAAKLAGKGGWRMWGAVLEDRPPAACEIWGNS